MPKQWNRRLPDETLRQIDELADAGGMTDVQVAVIAVDRMYRERMIEMPKSRRAQIVEQVALLMAECYERSLDHENWEQVEAAYREINTGDGFAIDLQAPLGNTLHIEGAALSDDEFAAAILYAKRMVQSGTRIA